MTTRFLLVRHGQIEANISMHWHGSTDSPLTDTGRDQARRVADWLKATDHRISHIYASPLQRTRDTAAAIAETLAMGVAHEADLREYGIGDLEGTHYRTLAEEHRFFERIRAEPDWAPSGGESMTGVLQRMHGALQRISANHAGEDIVIVSHGAAMAMTLAHLLEGDALAWDNYSLGNCSVTEFWLQPQPRLGLHNHRDHLQH